MASIIDHTFFVGEINIPNTGNVNVQEAIQFFIDKYEPELLEKVLGIDLYEAYKTGISESTPDQKWLDLRDGKVYTNLNSKSARWRGLKQAGDIQDRSFIASYVYYWIQRDKETQTTEIGERIPNSENASKASAAKKAARAWNEVVSAVDELVSFMEANKSTYTEWDSDNIRCICSEFRNINVLGI